MGFSETVARRDTGAYDALILSLVGNDYSLLALVKGTIAQESAWNPGALRWEAHINDGSYGLMQILLGTARMFQPSVTVSDLFIPEVNITLGVRFLMEKVRQYPLRDAVSAYNAGHPISGNQAYVDSVLTYQAWYMNAQAPREATGEVSYTDEGPPPDEASGPGLGTNEIIGLGIVGLVAVGLVLVKR